MSYGRKADTDLKLWNSLANCYLSVRRKIENMVNQQGLTMGQFSVLELLFHQGNHSISGIMQKIQSTPGNMTVVIENLSRSALIRKTKDSNDRRVTLISLSKEGENRIKDIIPSHILNLQNMFSHLDPREKSALIELSEKICTHIRE